MWSVLILKLDVVSFTVARKKSLPVGGILSKDVHSYKFYAVTKESEESELPTPLPSELPVSTALNFSFRSEPTSTYQLLNQRNYKAQQIVLQGAEVVRAERAQALDATLDVVLDRSDLGAGKMLDASLAISGQGTGDLYVVLMMPNGQYLSLGETRLASAIGEVIPFREAINLSAVKTLPLVNLPLPSGLVEGTYTFYAIFVAQKANVYDESNWVSLASSEWTYD